MTPRTISRASRPHACHTLHTRCDCGSQAAEAATTQALTLVQGPPGTGKTKVSLAVLRAWVDTNRWGGAGGMGGGGGGSGGADLGRRATHHAHGPTHHAHGPMRQDTSTPPAEGFLPASMDDRLLEVVAVEGVLQLGLAQMSLTNAIRL